MNGSKEFENEIALISDKDKQDFVRYYFDNNYVPKYFWEIGASSTGKYHPKFAQGDGGLVRHTKAVVMFAQELLRMSSYAFMKDEYKDLAIIACLCHDTCKYGESEFDKDRYSIHGELASQNVAQAWYDYFGTECPYLLTNAILTHMGQWSTERPFTQIDRLVHLSDYVASRNFIDIPSLAPTT